ncbi:MAG: hypothetical protein HY328_09695 [Chloroflexi bacterium]|nr:hypothetical protein [Chloroflexota bacterium]
MVQLAAIIQHISPRDKKGYDGVRGVKISHPTVMDGGVEVVVYGNGFRVRNEE